VEKSRFHLSKIRQHFSKNSLSDVKGKVAGELLYLKPFLKPGASIAIAVGSRGVRNLVDVVRETVKFIKENNAFPFIVPAMGSHGEANAAIQADILAGYGISEKTMGIPVRSSMEVVELDRGDSPVQVYMDKNAWESDGVILINRIKPHTDYHGRYESGLVKMSVIGLGKEKQASAIHRYGVIGLSDFLPLAAKEILSSGKILGGIALVENGYDETMIVKVLRHDEFFDKEPELLEIARKNMPSLPLDNIDVLIIDRMGKDISGVGLDPNIIGRIRIAGQKEPDHPSVRAIMISQITDASHGNAIGVGLADVITKKLYNKIDFSSTYMNGITSSFIERVKIPLVAGSDKEAFEIALRSCGFIKEGEEKIIRIKDTLNLDELYVSDMVLKMIGSSAGIERVEEGCDLFQINSDLIEF
jgi:hypothetical protein